MYPVSIAYRTAIQAGARDMRNISVTVGGSTYSRNSIRSLRLHESVSENADRLLPGCAACASLEVTLVASLSGDLVGSEMTARAGVVLAGGTVEYVPLGVFVVQTVKYDPNTNISTVVGYDRMCLLDGADFVTKSDEWENIDPATITFSFATLLRYISDSNNLQWASYPDVSVDNTKKVAVPLDGLHGYNVKELLGYIAGAHGWYARYNRDGLLEFAWYEDSGATVPLSCIYMDGLEWRSSGDVADIVTIYSGEDLEDGYGGYTNDLISSRWAAAASPISSVSSPGTMKYRGDMSIMAGDVISVNNRRFSVSEHTLTFNGGGLVGNIESHGLEQQITHTQTTTQRAITRLKKYYNIPLDDDLVTEEPS